MRKIISLCLIVGLGIMVLGPVLTSANGEIDTSLTRSGDSGGEDPIIKAKWEMLVEEDWHGSGTVEDPYILDDDVDTAGAQFMPTGIWGDREEDGDDGEVAFSICAIATDPDGVDDIYKVLTDWYYPANHAFHPAPEGLPDQIDGGTQSVPDYGVNGCDLPVTDENELLKLTKADGLALFCDTIRYDNNNLPTFFGSYDYDEICSETGELQKETAYVYCADKALEWEDPAGPYHVEVFANDRGGNFSYDTAPDDNFFKYLPFTGFEVDFDGVAYGDVQLATHKIISGDKTWDPTDSERPTVRNVGNTRLYMHVEQDDMGLGTTDGEWNVEYDARVGNNEADWAVYDPESPTILEDILDLSEVEEMDFSIEIFKFPTIDRDYTGHMDLWATLAKFRKCDPR